MDFQHSERARKVMDQVDRFVRKRVVPNEQTYHDQLVHTDDWTKWWQAARSRVKRDTMIETPGSVRSLGPEIGQHTDEILKEIGFDASEIALFREKGAVG